MPGILIRKVAFKISYMQVKSTKKKQMKFLVKITLYILQYNWSLKTASGESGGGGENWFLEGRLRAFKSPLIAIVALSLSAFSQASCLCLGDVMCFSLALTALVQM